MPDSSVFAHDSSFTNIQFEWAGANALLSPHERRMHLCETWGECLMPKHSLCILNEILLQGSLSSPLACVSMPASILLVLCPDTICTLVFMFGIHTHVPSLSHVLYDPTGATQKIIKPTQAIIWSNDIKNIFC